MGNRNTDKAALFFFHNHTRVFEDAQYSAECVTLVCQRQSGMYHGKYCLVQFIDEGATLACVVQAELC